MWLTLSHNFHLIALYLLHGLLNIESVWPILVISMVASNIQPFLGSPVSFTNFLNHRLYRLNACTQHTRPIFKTGQYIFQQGSRPGLNSRQACIQDQACIQAFTVCFTSLTSFATRSEQILTLSSYKLRILGADKCFG